MRRFAWRISELPGIFLCCGFRSWRRCLFKRRFLRAPHPSPLPQGEGTDWGIFEKYSDLSAFR
ncbi:hypothetical protein C1893_28995 [Pseudomonas sp. MPR-ANC1]|nr:hypothetical protein C1893_28995 [Pseudomonas sp. MPR-ANC1]